MFSETDSVTTQSSPDFSIRPAEQAASAAAEEQATAAYHEDPTTDEAAGFLCAEMQPEPQDEGDRQEEAPRERASAGEVLQLLLLGLLCLLMAFILACNVTLIVKGSLYPDVPPSLFGHTAMIVTTDVMRGEREDSFGNGDMILVRVLSDEQKQQLREGDIVTFRSDGYYMTLRVVGLDMQDGSLTALRVWGDNEEIAGNTINRVRLSEVIGVCRGSVAGIGSFFLFVATPKGALIFVGIPVLMYVLYDFVAVTIYNHRLKKRGREEQEGDLPQEQPDPFAEDAAAEEGLAEEAAAAGIALAALPIEQPRQNAEEHALPRVRQKKKQKRLRVQKPPCPRGEAKQPCERCSVQPRYPRGEQKPPHMRSPN